VAGGNTILLSPAAFEARFTHARSRDLVSRRADTTWCIDAQARGTRVVRASLPFFHDRLMRPKSPSSAAREALADALGVGVYRALIAGGVTETNVALFASARLDSLRSSLAEAEVVAHELAARGAPAELAEWIAEARGRLRFPATSISFFQGGTERQVRPIE
jgi:hypothetical protein